MDTKFLRCTFKVSNDFSENPQVMVFLNNSMAVPFVNCTFKGKTDPNPVSGTGIYGLGSSIRVEPEYLGTSGGHFSYLKNGIVLNNFLHGDASTLIKKAFFWCQNAVNLSGTFSPRILGNQSIGPIPGAVGDHNSFFLRNCPTFQMEGNSVAYDIGSPTMEKYSGIVIMNSGPANNEVYRNFIETANLDIQSIGTNRSNTGDPTGLKILCNSLSESQIPDDDYNITVMKESGNPINGIHNLQFVDDLSGDHSAGNRFIEYQPWAPPPGSLNYYLENGTNNFNYFTYKYNLAILKEKPVYRNFPNIQTALDNKCIIHNDGTPLPPFPFYSFVGKLNTLENEIQQVKNKVNKTYADTLQLSYLLGQHGKLIDSIGNYHLFENQIDSVALVYEQVTINYQYKVLLALIYRDKNQFSEAINLLNSLSDNYSLNEEEAIQIDHLATIFESLNWLQQNDNDWQNMPENLKNPVFDFEQNDPMYAGAIARALLAQYEGYQYDPIALMPEGIDQPFSQAIALEKKELIYPNPAQDQLFIDWTEDQSTLILTDIMGKEVLRENMKPGFTQVKIEHLQAGIYIAQIEKEGKICYQQKIVKH